MKYVKCVYESSGSLPITLNKIYEVVHFNRERELVEIVNDDGHEDLYYVSDTDVTWFVDATAFVREEKLNDLGI